MTERWTDMPTSGPDADASSQEVWDWVAEELKRAERLGLIGPVHQVSGALDDDS